MIKSKYTREILEPIIHESKSIADVLRKLGLATNCGGVHAHISTVIKKSGINTSHFLGVRSNCGDNHKGGVRKRSSEEILVKHEKGWRESSSILRRALKAIGREYKCSCGQGSEWNGKPLRLQIEHKNGNNLDNRPNNLEYLCPNCHTQTPTYGKIKESGGQGTIFTPNL